MVKLTFPDGTKKEVKKGTTVLDVAKGIGEGLAKAALAGKVYEQYVDLSFKIEKNAEFRIITFKDDAGKNIFKHSAAHVLAAAVQKLFPKAKFGIGPAVEDGFYYDFDIK